MIEKDDAIGDILFQAVACQRIVSLFARDDGCHAFVFEPSKEPAKLGAKDEGVGQSCKERFDRVEDDPFCPDRINRMFKADEEAVEVVFPGFFDLASLNADMVDQKSFGGSETVEIKPERGHILGQFLGGLLKGHEDPRLIELGSASHKKLHGKEGLAAAGSTADQCRATLGQPAICDFVQPAIPVGTFCKPPLSNFVFSLAMVISLLSKNSKPKL